MIQKKRRVSHVHIDSQYSLFNYVEISEPATKPAQNTGKEIDDPLLDAYGLVSLPHPLAEKIKSAIYGIKLKEFEDIIKEHGNKNKSLIEALTLNCVYTLITTKNIKNKEDVDKLKKIIKIANISGSNIVREAFKVLSEKLNKIK